MRMHWRTMFNSRMTSYLWITLITVLFVTNSRCVSSSSNDNQQINTVYIEGMMTVFLWANKYESFLYNISNSMVRINLHQEQNSIHDMTYVHNFAGGRFYCLIVRNSPPRRRLFERGRFSHVGTKSLLSWKTRPSVVRL